MNPITILMTALALGAAAGVQDTAEQAVKDAYAGLKALIQRKYPGVDVDQLEEDPTSEARKAALKEELATTEVAADAEVLEQAQQVLEAAQQSGEAARAIGVDLGAVKAASLQLSDIIARGSATGVRADSVETTGDVTISGVAATLNTGAAYNDQEALDYYRRALHIAEEAGDREELATALNNIGEVYDGLGQWQEALDYYQRALPIREEVGDLDRLATSLNNIGGIYNDLGRPQEALDYYQRALSIQEEVGNRAGESVTRYNMAMIYRNEGCLEEAIAEMRRVVELDEMLQYPELEQDRALLAQLEAELAAQDEEGTG